MPTEVHLRCASFLAARPKGAHFGGKIIEVQYWTDLLNLIFAFKHKAWINETGGER